MKRKLPEMLKKLNLELLGTAVDVSHNIEVFVLENKLGETIPYTYNEIVELYQAYLKKEFDF